jgi:pimeloyl-ACP methyl ester carboxylesterase
MKIISILLLAFFVFVVYLLLFQHRLIYLPRKYEFATLPPGLTAITYQLDGKKQTSFYLPPAESKGPGPDKIWIILGGNASLALDWLAFARRFDRSDTGFLLFDYPGYGKCEGKISPQNVLRSLENCLTTFSEQLHLSVSQLIQRTSVIGHSLGSAIALQFSLRRPITKIILISPFTSMLDMAKQIIPFPFYFLLLHRYDNVASLDALLAGKNKPAIFILHGSRDRTVPSKMSGELANRYANDVQYQEIQGADHNDIISVAESELYEIMAGPP